MSIHDIGVCEESIWPYDFSKFNERPSAEAMKELKETQYLNTSGLVKTNTS